MDPALAAVPRPGMTVWNGALTKYAANITAPAAGNETCKLSQATGAKHWQLLGISDGLAPAGARNFLECYPALRRNGSTLEFGEARFPPR
jgi:hypothetical protein